MIKSVKKGIVPGIILIGLGILLFLQNFHINTRDWILLGIGIVFLISYIFNRKNGLLITGIILSYFGAVQLLESFRLIRKAVYNPVILIALGLAFLTLYFVRKRTPVGFIFPGFILPAVGAYWYMMIEKSTDQAQIWPLIFMFIAVSFLCIFIFEFERFGFNPGIVAVGFFIVGVLGFLSTRGIISKQIWEDYWPVLLIVAGVVVMFMRSVHPHEKKD